MLYAQDFLRTSPTNPNSPVPSKRRLLGKRHDAYTRWIIVRTPFSSTPTSQGSSEQVAYSKSVFPRG